MVGAGLRQKRRLRQRLCQPLGFPLHPAPRPVPRPPPHPPPAMTESTPTLDECVSALVGQPDHPKAREWAALLLYAVERRLRLKLGGMTEQMRDEYHRLLSPLLSPTPHEAPSAS